MGRAAQAGTVLKELRRGYTWRGRLIRFAEVQAIRGAMGPEDEIDDDSDQSEMDPDELDAENESQDEDEDRDEDRTEPEPVHFR